MNIIILDTETTGLKNTTERIVEIGCVELNNFEQTGKTFHMYINPEKEMDMVVQKIHGITNDFLKDKPVFKDIHQEFLDFIKDYTIVAHNAKFDVGFINAEFDRCNAPKLKNKIIDTLSEARKMFPGSPANLNALAKRFNISLHERSVHGALIDAKILSKVYVSLFKPKHSSLFSAPTKKVDYNSEKTNFKISVSKEEDELYMKMIEELEDSKK